jgi:hypothetical protein
MTAPTSDAQLQAAIDAYAKLGTYPAAAAALGLSRTTLRDRIGVARARGFKPGQAPETPVAQGEYVKRLERDLKSAQNESADARAIKRVIGETADRAAAAKPPAWLTPERAAPSSPGVPTLFLSDFHWGEHVHPAQINGVNSYNLNIARRRLKDTIDSAVTLLKIVSQKLDYPGLVVPLGGDMVSGNIHEELEATNELNTIPTVLDLWEQLASGITHLADTFGQVFLPCVTGNHGRNTRKIWSKDRHHTSFDWMLYQILAKHFAADKRITFLIPDGSDAAYRIYSTRYNLTHGDQFRGGDGMIGPLGPITRGDHKKRSRNSQIDMDYDILIMGHWYQYIHLSKLIVNGALKGYDEYAYTGNFPFEKPQQALWITHPVYGPTFRMPVYCERSDKAPNRSWVAVVK